MTIEIRIGAYAVEIEPSQEREGVTDCWVFLASNRKMMASLAALEGTGQLENFNGGETHNVNPITIDRIRVLAEKHGY